MASKWDGIPKHLPYTEEAIMGILTRLFPGEEEALAIYVRERIAEVKANTHFSMQKETISLATIRHWANGYRSRMYKV